MFPAAHRFTVFGFALLVPFGARAADEPLIRMAPSRPAAVPTAAAGAGASATQASPVSMRKFAGIDYVSTVDVAARLGLKLVWIERGRKLNLIGPSGRAELENDTRDVSVNGLRVFLGDPILDAGGQLYVSRIDFEHCLTPLLRPGYGTAARAAPRTIVLDPGHGGKDNGTSVNEKTFALDVAKRSKKILETAGYRVVLTRDTDTFIELSDRAAFANASRGDLFVSIHFNAVPNDARTSGVEVFTFAPKGQHSAEWWSLSKKGDAHLEMIEMPVNRFNHWSVVLAQAVQRHFVFDLKSFDRGKKIAHWGVLRSLNCPGVLVECGFLTSDIEARKIATPAHRQKIAEAITAGIRDYAALSEGSRAKVSAASIRMERSDKFLN